jgi:hypothetical protein
MIQKKNIASWNSTIFHLFKYFWHPGSSVWWCSRTPAKNSVDLHQTELETGLTEQTKTQYSTVHKNSGSV